MNLRYTLINFEKNYYTKIPTKNKQFISFLFKNYTKIITMNKKKNKPTYKLYFVKLGKSINLLLGNTINLFFKNISSKKQNLKIPLY